MLVIDNNYNIASGGKIGASLIYCLTGEDDAATGYQ